MQKFCFRLNKTEEQFRHNIDTSIIYDAPETFLFSKNYGKGLSFTRNDEIIKGVYLQNSDKIDESFKRGVSIRVCFHGKIIHNDDGDFFTGWIYPDPLQLLFIICVFFSFLFFGETMIQKIISVVATAAFLFGFSSLTQKCFKELSFITSGE